MNWGEFILTALGVTGGGGIFGFVGAIFKARQENEARRIAIEDKKATAEIERERLRLTTEMKVKEGEFNAFRDSLQQGKSESDSSVEYLKAATASKMGWLAVLVESYRKTTRPNLTYITIGLYFWAVCRFEELQRKETILALPAMAGTALGWWFGSRSVLSGSLAAEAK